MFKFKANFAPANAMEAKNHVKNYELVSKFNGVEFGETSWHQILHRVIVMASSYVANDMIDEERICMAIRDCDSGEIALEVIDIPCHGDIDKARTDIENNLQWDRASMQTVRNLDSCGHIFRMAFDEFGGFSAPSKALYAATTYMLAFDSLKNEKGSLTRRLLDAAKKEPRDTRSAVLYAEKELFAAETFGTAEDVRRAKAYLGEELRSLEESYR